MRELITLSAFAVTLSLQAAPHHVDPCPDDTLVIHERYVALCDLLAERAMALASAEQRTQQHIALEMEERTTAWTDSVRALWPNDDDGFLAYSISSALASAYACSSPVLSAMYQTQATMALVTQEHPYRPHGYARIADVRDLAHALAHAKRPKRVARLAAKLQVRCTELAVR